jgi:sucrose-6-phosphate hydrolase SacC (GH32 family)
MFFNGVYHIFMQHSCGSGPADMDARCCRMGWPALDPGGPSCASQGVGWGHLTSVDAVHWKEQPVALAPPFVDISLRKTQAEQGYPGFVSAGYFTGSAQVVNGQPRLLFPAVFRAPHVTAEFPVSVVLSLAFSCTH